MILIFSNKTDVVSRISASLPGNPEVSESMAQLIRDVKRKKSTQLVVIGEDVSESDAITAGAQIEMQDPSIGIILIRNRVDLSIVSKAMASGIKGVFSNSDIQGLAQKAEELKEFSTRMRSKGAEVVEAKKSGKVILCYSPKGGVGKTTTSLNLAGALVSQGHGRAVVVDLDLQFGDVGVLSSTTNRDGDMEKLIGSTDTVDMDQLNSVLQEVQPGLDVLLAPSDPSQASAVSGQLVGQILAALSAEYDWVIVDSPPAFTDPILVAFDMADIQILITTSDLAAVKNLDLATKTLKKVGLDSCPRVVVVNRFDSKLADKSQILIAARDLSAADKAIVFPENQLITQGSSRGFIATLQKSGGSKVAQQYKDLIDFIVEKTKPEAV